MGVEQGLQRGDIAEFQRDVLVQLNVLLHVRCLARELQRSAGGQSLMVMLLIGACC